MFNSEENKFWLAFWFMSFTAIIGLVAVMGFVVNPPELRRVKAQQEFQLKMTCIQRGGNWAAVDNDNHPPYSCKMK